MREVAVHPMVRRRWLKALRKGGVEYITRGVDAVFGEKGWHWKLERLESNNAFGVFAPLTPR